MLNNHIDYDINEEERQQKLQEVSDKYLTGEADETELDKAEEELEVDYEKTSYSLTPVASEIRSAFKSLISCLRPKKLDRES